MGLDVEWLSVAISLKVFVAEEFTSIGHNFVPDSAAEARIVPETFQLTLNDYFFNELGE